MKTVAIIPARYKSSRFPGKPITNILGRPMIEWVYRAAESVSELSEIAVATDDQRIFDTVRSFGGNAVMTGDCACGTDRVYQAIKNISCNHVVNIQGDEPLIDAKTILEVMSAFEDPNVYASTLKNKITSLEDAKDTNAVKVITDDSDDAIYFSRSVIPYNRENTDISYFRAIGVYCFDKDFLKKYVSLPRGPLEIAESIEQLRILEHGYKMRVVQTNYNGFGVDSPEHVPIISKMLEKKYSKKQ